MTRSKRIRLDIVMRVAHWLGVPIDVHGSFFIAGKNSLSMSGKSGLPK